MKKFISLTMVISMIACLLILPGCNREEDTSSSESTLQSQNTSSEKVQHSSFQTDMPKPGEEVAVIHTNMGDICVKLFPEQAPKTVENFKTHAKEGYYNGLIFHRVIADFMIQGGDPKGTGMGGESIWGDTFEDEFSSEVVNINGSLSMANSGPNTNGSQFFINQTGNAGKIDWENIQTAYGETETYFNSLTGYSDEEMALYKGQFYTSFFNPSLMPESIKELYEAEGGNYFLDGAFNSIGRGHTVFGQVYFGMEVVKAIANVEKDSNDKPINDVVIESIEIKSYS